MRVVGLTGIMGAGKSSVARGLEFLGINVYDCDSRAKVIMRERCVGALTELLGEEVLTDVGELNRAYIASKIFSDNDLKIAVEKIVHSALSLDMAFWIESNKAADYVVIESAILFGSAIEKDMDVIVGVVADDSEIVERVIGRDGITKAQVMERIRSQRSQDEIVKRSDIVVKTANRELLLPKIVELDKKLLTLSLQNKTQ